MEKILVIGPTPPPFGGQAIMIQNLLSGKYSDVELYHVRSSFSKDMNEIGKLNFSKIRSLIVIIFNIVIIKFKYNIKYLYFGPGGPNLIPMYRDVIMLFFTRWLFKKTIFHFHAGSTYSLYSKIPKWFRYFYKKAYFYSDISIRITEFNPDDPEKLKAKKEFIIPNGIYDYYSHYEHNKDISNKIEEVTILFVGNVFKEKGIIELIEASNILLIRGLKFKVNVVGRFQSKEFEDVIIKKIEKYNLLDTIKFHGVLINDSLFQQYYNADIFCLPTYFETFGLVIAEAMQFCLPVVSTKVGGVSVLVKENENGFLIKKGAVDELVEKIEILIMNPELREKMGIRSRELFLNKFTISEFHKNMETVFKYLIN